MKLQLQQPAQVTGCGKMYLEPGPMLFVIPPGLPLQLSGSQVLLVSTRHVVEGKEEGLRVQLLKQGRVVQHRQLHLRVGSWNTCWR